VCVCNAGIIRAADFLEMTLEDFDAVMNVNVRGTFLTAQAAARAMVGQGGNKSIVLLSSMTAELSMPDQLAYSASKGAVRQMTKSMALTRHPQTLINTPEARKTILSRTPLGRLGLPDEIAGVAVFLACDDASYVTGQTVYADGGRLALNYTVAVD